MIDKRNKTLILGMASAVATVSPVFGQTPAQTSAAAEESNVAEVVITGSRIQGLTNQTSPSPISVISAEQIALTGATNVEDVLSRTIGPDFTNGDSNASNNGGTGLSVVGLRNLGPARTLILIDGQRLLGTYSGTTEVIDLSTVPATLIDRVEVLRDAASSIYGADAIGGVINIITKKDFEGISLDGTLGQSSHGEGTTKDLSGTIGLNTEKGNLTIALSWDKINPIQQFDRAWAENPHLGQAGEGGSTYRSQLDTLQDENSNNIWTNNSNYSLKNPAAAAFLPNDVYLPDAGRLKLNAGAPGWNYLTQGLDRKQISISSHYDLSSYVTFVADGFFTDRNSTGSLRPEPLLGDTIAGVVNGNVVFPGFYVPSFAPGYPTGVLRGLYQSDVAADQAAIAAGTLPATYIPGSGSAYKNYQSGFAAFLTPDQFGPRRYATDSQTYRIHFGFKGEFLDQYHWDAGFIDSHNSTNSLVYNEGNFEHLAQITGVLNCVDVPGGCTQLATPIQAADGSGRLITSIPTVSPNWFAGPNGIFTPQQVAYLTWTNTDRRTSTERISFADINGAILSLPGGKLRAAVGYEHRDEYLADDPDLLVQEGFGPNVSAVTAGGYSVNSAYVELNAPLLAALPLVKALTVDLSGRYDDYSSFGSARTYKIGVDFAPLDDIRLRASLSTGFRAPNVAELYGGQSITDLTANGDPCDTRAAGYNGNSNVGKGVLTAGSTCSRAVANGGPVTNFQSANNNQTQQQEQVLVGGNPKVQPEKSDNWGMGVVATPAVLPGFTLTADYYNIKVRNTILTGGITQATSVDAVLLGCYGPAQNQSYCNLITRNAQGTLVQVSSLVSNFGVARVDGIDYELSFDTSKARLNLPFPGAFLFDLQLSHQMNNTQTNADGTISKFNGAFQLQATEAIEPEWKGMATLEYRLGPLTAHWDTRYIEHMFSFDGLPAPDNRVPTVVYHDISASYRIGSTPGFKDAQVVFGVNNLLDQDPPFLSADSICKCNSLAGPYDFIGRFFYGRVSVKF